MGFFKKEILRFSREYAHVKQFPILKHYQSVVVGAGERGRGGNKLYLFKMHFFLFWYINKYNIFKEYSIKGKHLEL